MKHRSAADKIDGFIYFTFQISEDITFVISKLDGNELKLANKPSDNDLASPLPLSLFLSQH